MMGIGGQEGQCSLRSDDDITLGSSGQDDGGGLTDLRCTMVQEIQ